MNHLSTIFEHSWVKKCTEIQTQNVRVGSVSFEPCCLPSKPYKADLNSTLVLNIWNYFQQESLLAQRLVFQSPVRWLTLVTVFHHLFLSLNKYTADLRFFHLCWFVSTLNSSKGGDKNNVNKKNLVSWYFSAPVEGHKTKASNGQKSKWIQNQNLLPNKIASHQSLPSIS